MVKLLKNFHVDILMYDPVLSAQQISEIGAEKVSLEELMAQSDVVSVHAPSILFFLFFSPSQKNSIILLEL